MNRLIFIFIPTIWFVVVSTLYASELTFDISDYQYEELTSENQFYMEDNATFVFFSGGIRDWDKGLLKRTNSKWSLLYTAEYTQGTVSYYSGSGTLSKDYYKARIEGYLAREIHLSSDLRLSKILSHGTWKGFIGYGYRHLLDASAHSLTNLGATGYDRISQYHYVPVGFIWDKNERWSIKSQYNVWIKGKQLSKVQEVLPSTYNVNPKNTQYHGWGVDFTLNRKFYNAKWSSYTFFRYWKVDDSDWVSCASNLVCQEPRSTTREIGIGIAYKF